MNDKREDEEFDRNLERFSGLYAKVPEEEFSTEVVNRIKTAAWQSAKPAGLLRRISDWLTRPYASPAVAQRRLGVMTVAVALIAVFGVGGVIFFQTQSSYQPLILTSSELEDALLKDAAHILEEMSHPNQMLPAVNTRDDGTKDFEALRTELEDRKRTLTLAAKALADLDRTKDSNSLLKAIEELDAQLKAIPPKVVK